MKSILLAAVMIASQQGHTQASDEYSITLEAQAQVIHCMAPRANLTCFEVQGQTFAIEDEIPVGIEFTAAFVFRCNRDEECTVTNIYDAD